MLLSLLNFSLVVVLGIGGANSASAGDPSPLTIDPHDRRAAIREQLLKYTPLGMKSTDVLAVIAARLLKKGDPAPKIVNHPATGVSAGSGGNPGVTSIKLDLGEYLASPILLTLSPPLPIEESLSAQWAFDKDGMLIDLFLDREVQ